MWQVWDSAMNIDWSSVPGSSEFWAAIIGSIVGGVLTAFTAWNAERIRLNATARQEWRRIGDTDLREFQNAALLAVHALNHDVQRAWDNYEGSDSGGGSRWGPVESPAAYAVVGMISTRLNSESVRNDFAIMAQAISEAHGFMSKLPPPNPFISMFAIDISSDEPLTCHNCLTQATNKSKKAQRPLVKLQHSCAQAFGDLRETD
jgi:hypothetical protein